MATQPPVPISPREEEKKQVSELYRMLIHDGKAALLGSDNSTIELPPSIYEALIRVVSDLQEGKSIAIMPLMEKMSTQAAADYLGMSRQFFVKELEAGKVSFHYVGSHRRVYLKDVLEYKKNREQGRRKAIKDLARYSEEIGIYDTFVE
ncbi:MAG TPA: excisionase family DNA-binding protein, partial [Candidatus Angelobacter sp.]|nr:excisionase family DNA-binding protein [Candidatus Angelobacter sp.]